MPMINTNGKKEQVTLDRQSPVPLFVQIAETLKRRILSGQYNRGKQSFTGEELEKEFKTSNITIRKALEILKNGGFIERRRGLGTTISPRTFEPVVFELSSSFKKLVKSIEKMESEIKVLEISKVTASTYLQEMLSLSQDQKVWRIKRIRIHKKLPISFYTHYANPALCAEICKETAEKSNIIETLKKASGSQISKIRQSIRSIVADLDISTVLKIPFGAPVFFIENTYHDPSDKTLFLSQSYYRGDMFVFKATSRL